MSNIISLLNEQKKTFSIHEKIVKDGVSKKTTFIIKSSEKVLDGKRFDTANSAANEILKFKSPLKFIRKDINEQQKDIENFLKKHLVSLENK